MVYDKFPLMGFPGETNRPDGNVVYQCTFPTARIALWWVQMGFYELNIYKPWLDDAHRDDTLTDRCDRFSASQTPIRVNCVIEAQLAINYLIQKYLPTGVTNDFSIAGEEDGGQRNPVPSEERVCALLSHAATGEALE